MRVSPARIVELAEGAAVGPNRIGGGARASLRHALLLTTALSGLLPVLPQTAAALDVVVTNTNDSGAGSLRAAITAINGSVDPANNITFGNGFQGQITLLSNLPTITKTVNIDFAGDPTIFGGNFLGGNFGLGAAAAGVVVTINNSHVYTGNTTLTAGTLRVGVPIDGFRQFSDSKSLLVMSAGTIFDIPVGASSSFQNISGDGAITNNGSGNGLTIAGGNTTPRTFAGAISGTGKLTLFGGGEVLTLSGPNTYSGDTSIFGDVDVSGTSAFKVELAAGATNALSPNSAIFMIGAGTLRLNGFNQTIASLDASTISGAVSLVDLGAGTLTTGGNNTTTSVFASIIGTGGLIKTGTGTMTLISTVTGQFGDVFAAPITYSGATLVSGGTLQAGSVNAFSPNSAHTVNAGATLDLNNFNNTIASLAGAGNVTLGSGTLTTGGDNSSTTYSGVMSGTGGLTKNGNGTFTLTGDNTFTGATTISGGTLRLGNAGTTGTVVGNIVDNAILESLRSNTLLLPGTISGTGAFLQSGTGTTIFTGNNTYTGGTTISAGTLQLGNGGTSGSVVGNVTDNAVLAVNRSDNFVLGATISGTGAFQQNGTGTTRLTGTNTYAGGTTISNGTLQLGQGGNNATTGSIVGNVVNNGILAFGRSDAMTFSGVISGTGTVVQQNSGTTTLTATNTYSGGTVLNNGVLAVSANNNLGALSGGLTFDGGTLRALADFNSARAITLNSNGGTIGTNGFTVNWTGVVSGPGGLTKSGAGVLGLTADETYTGGTTISGGALRLGNGGTTGSILGDVVNNAALTINRSNAYTFGGLISGTGAFNQIGTGTTVLTNDNTFTGGTTISAGTLQLGNGGTSGSIVGNVLNNATLAFNRSNAFTLDGVISGTGAVQQNGAGTTTLTGNSTYTGPTTVNAGTLSVNGSIVSAVTVNSGGTLGGTGTVGSTTVNSGGALAPGNSIGTITVNGNLVLGAGATYVVEVSPSAADRTNVTGTASLNGTLNAVFTPGAYSSNSYTVLSAAGGRTGTFSSFTTTGLSPFLSASVSYTANDVMLVTLLSQIGNVSGLTFNERAVARTQDQIFNGGAGGIGALYNLSLAQLPGALDQLSGEVHASTVGVLADESLYARSAILGRLRQASYGGNTQMASLGAGGPQAFAGNDEISSALAYAKSPIVTKAPMKAPQAQSDVVFWAQGFGAWGRFNGDGNAASVKRDLAGFISGVDTRVGSDGRVGIAAGYTTSKNALDARGSSNAETGHIAGYGGWNFGAVNVRGGAALAFHTIDTDRIIAFPGFADRATAHYDGNTGQVFGEIGYGVALGTVAVEPFAGAAWVRVATDAAAERGGLAALNVSATTFETAYSTLGVRAASLIPVGSDMVLIPRGALAWQHAFDSVTPLAVLAFQTAPTIPFTIAGAPIARDSLLAEAGLDLAIGRSATIGVSYTGQIASNVQDHAAKGKFSWKF
jgi:outer membrane autotransporter protein